MLLNILSKSELIELIGEDLYAQTTDFLEKIFAGAEGNQSIELYQKKSIARLALSFATSVNLQKPEFWKNILGRLDQTVKQRLKSEFNIHQDLPAGILVERCLRLEFEQHDLRTDILVEKSKKNEAVTICQASEHPLKRLKDYQQGIYLRALEKLKISRNRLIIQMPTGSGKTRTAMEVVTEFINRNPTQNVLWLAHSVDLVDQAAECFSEVWMHLGLVDVSLRLVDGQRNGLENMDDEPSFIVSTFQSMISKLGASEHEGGKFISTLALVVVDEAHMSLAPTYNALIKQVISKGAKLIGLTATPGRGSETHDENQELAEFYLKNMIDLPSPRGTSVFRYLRNIGVLSRARMVELPGAKLQLTSSEVQKIQREFSVPKSLLLKLGREELRNIYIVCQIRDLLKEDSGRRILLFACSVEHSKLLVSICMYLGYSAAHVDGSTAANRRSALINDFRDGGIQILSNFGVLSTGFDAPKTDVVFIARPTASIVLYSQMIGRGLRGPAIGGTEECIIVNVRDNLVGLPNPDDIYDYFSEYYVS